MITTLSQEDRRVALRRMSAEPIDVLVIGGGITGVSVAYDAALNGYSVGLIEKRDYASGTSSKSTKLAHGGIRYLPQMDFALVREALVERERLFQNAPWLVKPLEFVLPLYEWSKRPLGVPFAPPARVGLAPMVDAGLALYDTLAGKLNVHRHSQLSPDEVRSLAPSLSTSDLREAFAYYDGQTDDVRLTLAILRSAARSNAMVANYAEAASFEIADGAIRAVTVRDTLGGSEYVVRARHVVNAAGVHAARIEELTGQPSEIVISPAKGVHLFVSREKLPMTDSAIVLPETDDGRLMFIIPWREIVLIGTTDTEGGDIDEPTTTEADVAYLLAHCNRYLTVKLFREDIVSTTAGFRPLIRRRNGSSKRLSRSHLLHDGPCGIVSITGGKLTTCRRMAEETVKHLAKKDGRPYGPYTRQRQLDGAEGWPVLWPDHPALPAEVRRHLEETYGGNAVLVAELVAEDASLGAKLAPPLPYLRAEAIYACRYEQAATVEDVLERRTRIALETTDNGVSASRDVAALMARELGWTEERVREEIAAYAPRSPIRRGAGNLIPRPLSVSLLTKDKARAGRNRFAAGHKFCFPFPLS
jgi:glycerol-3-phosphate dehydrogenase